MAIDSNHMSASEAAKLWGLSTRRVRQLCNQFRIFKARRNEDGEWIIPRGANPPVDERAFRYRKVPNHEKDLVRYLEAMIKEVRKLPPTDTEAWWHYFLLGATYHMHTIKHAHVTRAQVFSIVNGDIPANCRRKDVAEVQNFAKALEAVRAAVHAKRRLTFTLFRELLLTMTGRKRMSGKWIRSEIDQQIIEYLLEHARSKKLHPVIQAGDFLNEMHLRKPLTCHNEQIGYLIANFILMRNGYPPFIIYRVIFTTMRRYHEEWLRRLRRVGDIRHVVPPPQQRRAFINACVIRATIRAINFLRFSH